jgi:hypothetical protein
MSSYPMSRAPLLPGQGKRQFIPRVTLSVRPLLTELWIFRQSAPGAYFYRISIILACPPMIDLGFNTLGSKLYYIQRLRFR